MLEMQKLENNGEKGIKKFLDNLQFNRVGGIWNSMEIKNLVALNGVAARKFHCISRSKVTRQLYTDRCPTGIH